MQKKRTVNIYVCGKFHILNYVTKLKELDSLQNLYYSHRLKSMNEYNLNKKWAKNFYIKEYLIQLHGRVLGSVFYEKFILFYMKIWENNVLKEVTNSDIIHILAQGACLNIINKAKENKSKIIIEVVNTHPQNRLDIINDECEKWKIDNKRNHLFIREERIINEVMLSDILLVPSNIVANSYISKGYKGTIEKIPYVVNIERFKKAKKNKIDYYHKNKIKIISVGAIGLRKGQLYILECLKKMNIDNIDLTLVGVIDDNLKSVIKNIDYKFTHYERIPYSEMPNFISSHDIYVASSLEEGLSLTIVEAMSLGLSVIATKESGAEEIIKNKENGFIIESKNLNQLEQLITQLSKDNDLRYKIGQNAINETTKNLNWDNYAMRLKSIYEK